MFRDNNQQQTRSAPDHHLHLVITGVHPRHEVGLAGQLEVEAGQHTAVPPEHVALEIFVCTVRKNIF